jgi:hypothetical protein
MAKMQKIVINSRVELDAVMHFSIGASWDDITDRYPALYPVLLVMSKSRQDWDYIYKSDLK